MKHFDKILAIVLFCLFGCANKEVQLDCLGGTLRQLDKEIPTAACYKPDGTRIEKFDNNYVVCELKFDTTDHNVQTDCAYEDGEESHFVVSKYKGSQNLAYTVQTVVPVTHMGIFREHENGELVHEEIVDKNGMLRTYQHKSEGVVTVEHFDADGNAFEPCVYAMNIPVTKCSYIDVYGFSTDITFVRTPIGYAQQKFEVTEDVHNEWNNIQLGNIRIVSHYNTANDAADYLHVAFYLNDKNGWINVI